MLDNKASSIAPSKWLIALTGKGILLVLFLTNIAVYGQSSAELEKKKKDIQNEILKADKLLQETKKSKNVSVNQLNILQKKISNRENLIKTIDAQIKEIEDKIEQNQKTVAAMEGDLKTLKQEYARLIYSAYKHRSTYDQIMFVLAAEDFNQVYKRIRYLQQYSDYRENQALLIKTTQETLNQKNELLALQKNEKLQLLDLKNGEIVQLSSEKTDKEGVVSELQKREKELKKEIQKKQRENNRLEAAIREAIKKEMEVKLAASEIKDLSKEAVGFSGNKGKLLFPVGNGIVTGSFGKHPHPVLKYVEIDNKGIDISTPAGEKAIAVFEGLVRKVIVVPGAGRAVLVRHGEYWTVYNKLKEVFVKPGDQLKLGQEIGTIINDESTGKSILHFEIWKGQSILDPSEWLKIKD